MEELLLAFSRYWAVLEVLMMLPVLIAMAVAPRRSHLSMRGAQISLASVFRVERA